MATRAVNLDEELGCVSVLMHLSRAGVVSIRFSPALQQFFESLPAVEQREVNRKLQQSADVLQALSKAQDNASQTPAQQAATSTEPSAQHDLQPTGAAEMHAASHDRTEANVPVSSRSAALPSGQATALPRHFCAEKRRPKQPVGRPLPSILQMCSSVRRHTVGRDYHKAQLKAYLTGVIGYAGRMATDISHQSLVILAVNETRCRPGVSSLTSFVYTEVYKSNCNVLDANAEFEEGQAAAMPSGQHAPAQADREVSMQQQS